MINVKNTALIIGLVLIFSGCSAKEFEKGANDIGDDISKLFEVRE
jgi:hypothetical protein